MHIPLDYYRILGLPVQATAEQVRQAHYDRTLQRPKWDYSDVAIAARKSLLDDAFDVLSHQGHRQRYDAQVLPQALDHPTQPSDLAEADTYDLDITELLNPDLSESSFNLESQLSTPTLEITDEQLIGALIIYLELSEYELILNLSELYGNPAHFQQLQLSQPQPLREDLVLTVAIASTELGREQWKHGHYETAAESLHSGLLFLANHQLLPEFTQTLETELFKLRPYRILELLALPDLRHPDRQRGLQLLQDMLTERHGIDGSGNDRSGLDTDDFLRFIQQLRGYLTADEQIDVFADRFAQSSAVSTYLQVYALIGKGFANHQPEFIRQANQSLHLLASRQDVHLEQAVCCLLLGQTQLSFRLLENSQDATVQNFLQTRSPEPDDFLPGLCRYVEYWLQQEVLPYCRGLNKLESRLNPYFEDPVVQTDLEQYLADAEWQMTSSYNHTTNHTTNHTGDRGNYDRGNYDRVDYEKAALGGTTWASPTPAIPSQPQVAASGVAARSPGQQRFQTRQHPPDPSGQQRSSAAPVYANSHVSGGQASSGVATMTRPTTRPTNRFSEAQPQTALTSRPELDYAERSVGDLSSGFVTTSHFTPARSGGAEPPTRLGAAPRTKPNRRRGTRRQQNRLGLLLACGVGIGLAAVGLRHILNPSSATELTGEQLAIQVDAPLFPEWDALATVATTVSPTASGSPSPSSPQITPDEAKAILETWLSAKASAMGQQHELQGLETVLTGSMLSSWQQNAQSAKREGWYVVFRHELVANSLKVEPLDPLRSQVSAEIREMSEEFIQGSTQPKSKLEEKLLAKYELVFQNGKWRIQNADVIKQG